MLYFSLLFHIVSVFIIHRYNLCSGNKPFACDICNKSYLFPYELRRHKISAHNIDQEIVGESIGKNDGVNDEISEHDDNDINYDNNDLSDDENDFKDDDND